MKSCPVTVGAVSSGGRKRGFTPFGVVAGCVGAGGGRVHRHGWGRRAQAVSMPMAADGAWTVPCRLSESGRWVPDA